MASECSKDATKGNLTNLEYCNNTRNYAGNLNNACVIGLLCERLAHVYVHMVSISYGLFNHIRVPVSVITISVA